MRSLSYVSYIHFDLLIYHVAGLPWEDNEVVHERWCNDLAAKFLCVFVIDRFGDFVSDQVCLSIPSGYLIADAPGLGCRTGEGNCFANSRLTFTAHAPKIGPSRPFHPSPDDSTGLSRDFQTNKWEFDEREG